MYIIISYCTITPLPIFIIYVYNDTRTYDKREKYCLYLFSLLYTRFLGTIKYFFFFFFKKNPFVTHEMTVLHEIPKKRKKKLD
jgi:hypothetical protein